MKQVYIFEKLIARRLLEFLLKKHNFLQKSVWF